MVKFCASIHVVNAYGITCPSTRPIYLLITQQLLQEGWDVGYPHSGIACLLVVWLNAIAKAAPPIPRGCAWGVAQGCQAQRVPSGAGTRLGLRSVCVPGGSSQSCCLQALLLLEAAKAPHSPAFSTSTKCETVPARGGSCETEKGRLESQPGAWGWRDEPEARLNAGSEAQKASLLLPADTSPVLPPCRAGKGLPGPSGRARGSALSQGDNGRLSRPPSPK